MERWQLWRLEDDEGIEWAMVRLSDTALMAEVAARGMSLVWEVTAKGHNAAMQARNEFLGWEPYKPMLGPDGQPFPEDEDDALRTEGDR